MSSCELQLILGTFFALVVAAAAVVAVVVPGAVVVSGVLAVVAVVSVVRSTAFEIPVDKAEEEARTPFPGATNINIIRSELTASFAGDIN